MSPIQPLSDRPSTQFFGQVSPSFSLDPEPRNLTFQFLEHSDPDRSTVVRKKAREWVNKSKEDAEKSKGRLQKRTKTQTSKLLQRKGPILARESGSVPGFIMELRSFDAFGTLPKIQKDYNHIIQYCESHLAVSMP